jgi:hypothetical protein
MTAIFSFAAGALAATLVARLKIERLTKQLDAQKTMAIELTYRCQDAMLGRWPRPEERRADRHNRVGNPR